MPYKKCPRCNLNYIKDTEVLCKVCLEEVGKNINDFDKDEEYDICPECGENIIKAGEDIVINAWSADWKMWIGGFKSMYGRCFIR